MIRLLRPLLARPFHFLLALLLLPAANRTLKAAIIGLDIPDGRVSVTAGVDGGGDITVKADGTGFVVYETADASNGGISFKQSDANWHLVPGPVAAINTFTTNCQSVPSIGMAYRAKV